MSTTSEKPGQPTQDVDPFWPNYRVMRKVLADPAGRTDARLLLHAWRAGGPFGVGLWAALKLVSAVSECQKLDGRVVRRGD